ncbi:MAG: rhomboid family intramembrane serine protease [Fimbriimonadaceae bacterium]|nr:rhomboid family intramembrane serine protease [Fimbriimonadaceae bacterium]
MSVLSDFQSNARRLGAPVTVALVVLIIVTFLAQFVAPKSFPIRDWAYFTVDGISRPWSLLSYPFAANEIFSVLFAALWLWGIGASVEREMGSVRFGISWAAFSVLSALCLFVGARIVGVDAPLAGAWVALGAVTVIWGTRNPDAPLTLLFVLPLTGRWIAWLAGVFAFFSTDAKLALFAALPLILAYFFAANKLPLAFTKGAARPFQKSQGATKVRGAGVYSQEYFDEVEKREREREEKERLKKLFEKSLIQDPDAKEE